MTEKIMYEATWYGTPAIKKLTVTHETKCFVTVRGSSVRTAKTTEHSAIFGTRQEALNWANEKCTSEILFCKRQIDYLIQKIERITDATNLLTGGTL